MIEGKKCPNCKKIVPNNTYQCPHCGALINIKK